MLNSFNFITAMKGEGYIFLSQGQKIVKANENYNLDKPSKMLLTNFYWQRTQIYGEDENITIEENAPQQWEVPILLLLMRENAKEKKCGKSFLENAM